MDLRKFEAAGTQECCRCSFQQFCVKFIGNIFRQINVALLKKPLNAVQHSIYFSGAAVLCSAVYSGEAGVNCSCRAA